ncbi:MAG: sigma-70 family RNA polymerase sigma factor [Clostridiales bacterium]|nr:sigma-70 family RNA polymerase sigma factor [Clostridiales bacterium]
MNDSILTDETLCYRVAQGDQAAEETLVQRYVRMVRVCARPLFLMGGDSEDLTQEGMVGLLAAIRSYSPQRGGSFHAYAEVCVKNRMISAVRSASGKHHTPLNDSIPIETPLFDENCHCTAMLPETDPEEILITRESVQERLGSMFSKLSDFEAEILKLYLSGLSYSEIADQLGRTVKSVDNAIQRIRRKLDS